MFVDSFWGNEIEGTTEELYNRINTRNRMNTHPLTYNCAGYALETFNWYVPVPSGSDTEDIEWGSFEELERNAMSFEFISQILADFFLRVDVPDVRHHVIIIGDVEGGEFLAK